MEQRQTKKTPLYLQAKEHILGKMERLEYTRGSRIPSEPELAASLGISRETVRHAISELVSEGLLERRHGCGTFVTAATLERDLSQIQFTGELGSFYHLIRVGETPADRSIASPLELPLHTGVTEITRLRYLRNDKVPCILSRSYFRAGRFPGMERRDLTRRIYDLIELDFQTPLLHAKTLVESVLLREEEAEYLQVTPEVPVLMLSRTCYTFGGEAIILTKNFLRPDKCRMLIET